MLASFEFDGRQIRQVLFDFIDVQCRIAINEVGSCYFVQVDVDARRRIVGKQRAHLINVQSVFDLTRVFNARQLTAAVHKRDKTDEQNNVHFELSFLL